MATELRPTCKTYVFPVIDNILINGNTIGALLQKFFKIA